MALKHSKPPQALLNELIDVSDASAALVAEIRIANGLPAAFPKDAVLDLCFGLQQLQHGTAEGCRVPLEYARMRIPSIRRAYISREFDDPEAELEAPSLTRGMAVDKAFQALIASVTTALDEYRNLASETSGDAISVDPEYDSKDVDKVPVITQSHELSVDLGKVSKRLSEVLKPDSSRADDLKRVVTDAENINKLARSELKQSAILVRWLKFLSAKLRDTPKILRATAKAIRVSADVVEPLIKYWSETETKISEFLFERYRKFGDAVSEIAERLEEKSPISSKSENGFGLDPDIERGFEHWLLLFIEQRIGDRESIDASLFYPEVKHLTGLTSIEFAKLKGFPSFKELLKNQTLIEIIPNRNSYMVKPKTGQARQKALREMRATALFRLFWPKTYIDRFKKGTVFNGTNLLNSSIYRIDTVYSYLKITQSTIDDLLSTLPGIKKASDENAGTYIVEDSEEFLKSILPPMYLDIMGYLDKR